MSTLYQRIVDKPKKGENDDELIDKDEDSNENIIEREEKKTPDELISKKNAKVPVSALGVLWTRLFGCIVGIFFGLLFSFLVVGAFFVDCDQYEFRRCNDRGVCVKSVCECTDPFFSGSACQETQVLGYQTRTNLVCNGRGIVSPFTLESDISEECRVLGWDSTRCVTSVQNTRLKIANGEVVTREEVLSTPICFCDPPYTGDACEFDARNSLTSIQGSLCSGRGNETVDYFFNDTGRTSSGVQCLEDASLFLLDSLKSIDFDKAQQIRSKYLTQFSRGFCAGNPIRINSDAIVPGGQLQSNYRCRCAEPYEGDICQFGRCPTDEYDVTCSGHGNPLYGFGVELNTTRNDEGECSAICMGHRCEDGECKPDAGLCRRDQFAPVVCPPERPFRCSTGYCSAAPDPLKSDLYCGDGLEYGWYDDLNAQRKLCTLANGACGGDESQTTADGRIIPAGQLNFTSPLAFYRMRLSLGARVVFREEGVIVQEKTAIQDGEDFAGVIRRNFEQVESERYELFSSGISIVREIDQFILWPAPYLLDVNEVVPSEYEQIQLRKDGGFFAQLDIRSSRVVHDGRSDYGIARDANGLIVRPFGTVNVDNVTCWENMQDCVWNATTGFSLDGTRKICNVLGELISLPSRNCANVTLDERVYAAMVGVPGKDDADLTRGVWDLYVEKQDPLYFYSIEGGPVFDVEYLTVEDLRRPCVCVPFRTNETVYDAEYYRQERRSAPSNVGDFAVGSRDVDGRQVLFRGAMTSVENPLRMNINGYDEDVQVNKVREITKREYHLGNPNCDVNVFPSRYANGECARLSTYDVNVPATCECESSNEIGTVCTCTNTLTDTIQCTCNDLVCTCDNEGVGVFADQLYVAKENALSEFCVTARVGKERGEMESTNQMYDNETGLTNWTFTSTSFEFPGFPREFKIENECFGDDEFRLLARSRLFTDVFTQLNVTATCEGLNTYIIPSFDLNVVYDEWIIESEAFTPPSVYWTPEGIPISFLDTITVTAKNNQVDANNVLTNADITWSSGVVAHKTWIQFDFTSKYWVDGIWVNLKRGGLLRDDGRILPNQIQIEWLDGNVWKVYNNFVSEIFNGTETHMVMPKDGVSKFTSSLRMSSFFQMEVRILLPLTDQTCKGGKLIGYNRNIVYESLQALERSNLTLPCVSIDDCLLNGFDVTGDGICQDERLIYGPVIPFENVIQRNFPDVIISFALGMPLENDARALYLNLTYEVEEEYLYRWQLANDTCAPFFDVFPSNVSVDQFLFNGTCVWYYANAQSTFLFDSNTGILYQPHLEHAPNGAPYFGSQYCRAGTDFTDCGASNRLADIDAGLSCLDQRIADDLLNRQDFVSEEGLTIKTYISKGASFSFTLQENLLVTRVGRDTSVLDDCSGRILCDDGTCADHKCPQTLYNCKGDGCTLADPNLVEYKCACEKGYGGISCGIHRTQDGDPKVYETDASLWHHAGRPCPLRIKPPGGFKKGIYRTHDVENLMYPDGDFSQEALIRPECAPFGNVFVRFVDEGDNSGFYTTCGYYRATPWNTPISYYESIELYDVDGGVRKWRTFTDLQGNEVEYRWLKPTSFDDFPFRCPATGHCVAKESDCYQLSDIEPNCNGHGFGLADGTCECERGWRTFLFTDVFTQTKSVPYTVVDEETGDTNPTIWGGRPNDNWRKWSPFWCKARDCDIVDCSKPTGCFTGSKERNFQDRRIACGPESGYEGMCAIDSQACGRGEVSEPLICSGKGVLRKKTYTDEEWYCECGDTISDDARETTELIPNGWGGPRCDQYYCNNPLFQQIWFEKFDVVNQDFHRDTLDAPLPGKYRSNDCGAPVGPDPEDIQTWQNCCPGIKRLEQCTTVPCRVGNEIQCLSHDECQGIRRKPLVYPCNNHGRARVDGTCECEEGYTYDEERFSEKGCFKEVFCPVAPQSQLVCNGHPSCGADFDTWILPKIDFFEQQMWTAIGRMGLPITNRTMVQLIAGAIGQTDRMKEQAYINSAQATLAAEVDFSACIAVFPDDDPANPRGMRPYDQQTDEIFYRRGFTFPYRITPLGLGILEDNLIWSGDFQQEGVHYSSLEYTDDSLSVLEIPLNGTYTIDYVRIHGRKEVVDGTEMEMSIRGDSNNELCSGTSGLSMIINDYDGESESKRGIWYVQQCGESYVNYIFPPGQFEINCGVEEESESCITFQESECERVGGFIRVPGDPDPFPGCSGRCCLKVSSSETTTRVLIKYQSPFSNAELGVKFLLDEIQIYGHRDVVLDMPELLREELRLRVGLEGDGCQDYALLQSQLGNQGESYIPADYSERVADRDDGEILIERGDAEEANDLCALTGGFLSSAIEGEALNNYARTHGIACYDNQLLSDEQETGCLVAARDSVNYDTAPISKVIEESCTNYGCWSSKPGKRYDIYSTPDIRSSDTSTWGNQWKTNPFDNQLAWIDAASRMHELQLAQYKVDLEWVNTGLGYYNGWRNSGNQVTSGDIFTWILGWTAVYPSYSWIFNQQEVHNRENENTNLEPSIFHTIPARSANVDPSLVTQQLTRLTKLESSIWWPRVTLRNGVRVPVPRSYGKLYATLPLQDVSGIPVTALPPYTYSANYLGSQSSRQEMVPVRDSVIETETWTNEQVCKITFTTGTQCGSQIFRGYYSLFGSYAPSENQISFQIKPGNDYYFLYKNLAAGDIYTNDCRLLDGKRCGNRAYDLTLGHETREVLSDLSDFSVLVEGPCNLIGVDDNLNGVTFEGALPGTEARPWIFNHHFAQGARLGVGCYDHRKEKIRSWYVVPRFRSAKVKTRVKARRTKSGGAEDYNIGWETHPYMMANIELEVLATLGKHGPPLPEFEDLEEPDDPFNLGTYDNPCNYEKPESTLQGNWDAVDLGIICALKEWLPGGSETKKPRYLDSNMVAKFITDDNLNIVHPFVTSESAGRNVIECSECPKLLDQGEWVWNQQVQTSVLTEFQTGVDAMSSTTSTEGTNAQAIVRPQLHTLVNKIPITIPEYAINNIEKNARNMAYWLKSEYKIEWYLDQCVRVVRFSDSATSFRYEPTVCEVPHTLLCQRDTNKYTIRTGFQADLCGDSGRPLGVAQPNATCFDRYVRADKELFAFLHSIKEAYLAGALSTFIQTTDYDWDQAAEFIFNDTNSYALLFPEIQEFLQQSKSTQPAYVTKGATEDSFSWLNFAIGNLYPVECGEVANPNTGVVKNLCARTVDQCSWDLLSNQTEMAEEDYPRILDPISSSEEHRFLSRCGVLVKPSLYNVRDEFGAGVLTTDDFNFISADTDGSVNVQALGANGTWLNAGKNSHQYTIVDNRTHYITGEVTCPGNCDIELFMGNINVAFGTPDSIILLATRTGSGTFDVTLNNQNNSVVYQVFGWTIRGLSVGDSVKINSLIISNAQTIDLCQQDLLKQNWKNPPSVIQSGQVLKNECVYTEERKNQLNVPAVGVCYCSGRAYGGAACDSLALDTADGSRVCGGVGDGNSFAIAPDGQIVPVDENGAYYWGFNDPGCKCIDVGSVLRTYRNPAQGSGYEFLLSVDRPRNSPNFEIVPVPSGNEIISIEPPLDLQDVRATCASATTALPSWTSSNQVNDYFNFFADRPNYVDLNIVSGSLIWDERNFVIKEQVSDNSTLVGIPSDTEEIKALNFNNLAYLLSTDVTAATDGILQDYAQSLTSNLNDVSVITLEFTEPFGNEIEISIYSDETMPINLRAQLDPPDSGSTSTCTFVDTGNGYYRAEGCNTDIGVTDTIRIAGAVGTYNWKEIVVLNATFTEQGQQIVSGRSTYFS